MPQGRGENARLGRGLGESPFSVGLVGERLNSCRVMCIPVGGCIPWGPESHVPERCGTS